MTSETGRPRAGGVPCILALAALQGGLGAQGVGYQGPSLSGAGPTVGAPSVTASKPESKLWFHDGSWWGSLWSASAQAFRIHRLAPGSHVWTDTGVAVEARPDSHSDALWTGTKLYIATHEFAQGAGSPGHPILLLRYSYGGEGFALDAGFPVAIGNSSTESLVIDQDSTGKVWAAWMQGLRVHVSHSLASDTAWSTPAVLPGCTSDVTTDDICSLVAFGGDRIGVMWSDRTLDTFFFAARQDGAPDASWLPVEHALAGGADDHIDLAADAAGRVFAAVKDDTDDVELLVRGTAGGWQAFPVAEGGNNWSRPILLLDEVARVVHVFATRAGAIRQKTARMDAPAFPQGIGRLVLRDSLGVLIDPTSTKQNLRRTTGLVVLAANDSTSGHYWHHEARGPARRLTLFGNGSVPGAVTTTFALVVSGVSPHGWVRFVVGRGAPAGAGATIGVVRADRDGTAQLAGLVPRALVGTEWPVQAIEERSGRTSEPFSLRL